MNHPAWKGGSVETRRSSQSWTSRSAMINDVTVLRSWSNPYSETELLLGFVSWTELTDTSPKRKKRFLFKVLETEAQGHLLQGLRRNRNRHRPPRHLMLSQRSRTRSNKNLMDNCLFFIVNDNGLISNRQDPALSGCLKVSKYMIRLLRHVEEVPREQDGAVRYDDLRTKFKIRFQSTEQWSVSAWTSFLVRGWGPKKDSNIAWFPFWNPISQTIPLPQTDPGTFRRNLRWSYIARQCTVTGRLRRVHLPHRERYIHALYCQQWTDSRWKTAQKRETMRVLYSREPDGQASISRNCTIRPGQSSHFGVQKWLDSSSRYSKLVQFDTRSQKRIAVLSNTIARKRLVQHSTFDLYWQSGV